MRKVIKSKSILGQKDVKLIYAFKYSKQTKNDKSSKKKCRKRFSFISEGEHSILFLVGKLLSKIHEFSTK